MPKGGLALAVPCLEACPPCPRCLDARHPHDVMGVHGTWLNAPTAMWWDDPNAARALEKALSPGARFDELHGPLQGLRFEKRSIQLELHVDFARQHPLFVCEHERGLAFAHSLWRLVELMRTMGWPVEPDVKASALLVAHGAILGTRTLVQGVSKLMPGHTCVGRPRVPPFDPGWIWSKRHVVQDMTEAIELVDHAFMTSVESMVTTNQAHGCAQVNLLSGGLDSRLGAPGDPTACPRRSKPVLRQNWEHGPNHRRRSRPVPRHAASFSQPRTGRVHDVAGHGGRLRRHSEPFGFGPPQIRPGGHFKDGHGGVGIGPNRQRPLHREGPAAHA